MRWLNDHQKARTLPGQKITRFEPDNLVLMPDCPGLNHGSATYELCVSVSILLNFSVLEFHHLLNGHDIVPI